MGYDSVAHESMQMVALLNLQFGECLSVYGSSLEEDQETNP